jgi:hypothetical protein
MKENGKMIRNMDKENTFMLMVMYMKVIITKELNKDMESIYMRVEINMQESGLMIIWKDLE